VPPTVAVTVLVSAVRPPSSGPTTWMVYPPYMPVMVCTVSTGAGVMTVALPEASVVSRGRGVTVAVIVIVVELAWVMTKPVLTARLSLVIRGSVTVVGSLLGYAVLER
jgi:hypothetical protein